MNEINRCHFCKPSCLGDLQTASKTCLLKSFGWIHSTTFHWLEICYNDNFVLVPKWLIYPIIRVEIQWPCQPCHFMLISVVSLWHLLNLKASFEYYYKWYLSLFSMWITCRSVAWIFWFIWLFFTWNPALFTWWNQGKLFLSHGNPGLTILLLNFPFLGQEVGRS